MVYVLTRFRSRLNCSFLAACTALLLVMAGTSHADIVFRLHGSNTVGAELGPALATKYMQTQLNALNVRYIPGEKPQEGIVRGFVDGIKQPLEIEIQAHGSSTAFKDLYAGKTDIGMASRAIKEKEVKKLSKLGDMKSVDAEYVIGLDGIAVIVNASNTIDKLSKQQIADVFSGKITNWQQLGRKPGGIQVYARDDQSGTYDTFKSLVLGKTMKLTPKAKRYESNQVLSEDVSKDINAIGFVGLPYINQSKAVSVVVGEGAGRQPTVFNVATEDYALSRRLYMYTSPLNKNEHINRFLEFVASEAGQEVVGQVGFVSQNIYAETPVIGENYPQEYRKFVEKAKRLSVNIRFKEGSLDLDNRAIHDLNRITDYIKSNGFKKVYLFGFSEDSQLPMFNLSMSETRADHVALYLKRQGVYASHIRGYGAVDLVDSNSSQEKNRRVEIWVKK